MPFVSRLLSKTIQNSKNNIFFNLHLSVTACQGDGAHTENLSFILPIHLVVFKQCITLEKKCAKDEKLYKGSFE